MLLAQVEKQNDAKLYDLVAYYSIPSFASDKFPIAALHFANSAIIRATICLLEAFVIA